MDSTPKFSRFSAIVYCALAAFIMAYGWGYRGTVGHEAGAMVPAALLGMVLALGSGRTDWHRRSLVVGLFSAVGFCWGGSLSYMEQTFYVSSDSFIDVLYGFTMLFFLGALWAGIGGAGIGFALTEPRSVLQSVIRVFTAVCSVFLIVYLYHFFNPEMREAYETFTVRHFHDGDWLPATITLVVAGLYWILRPKDREAAALFFWGAVAWWVGYGLLTKIGALRLGPLHRSESWGGVLGVLIVVLLFLIRRKNRAARMMMLYGILSGGLGFVLAVFFRHPLMVDWGPFESWPAMPDWRIAEDSFGFFMGLGLSLGALRLLRNGIEPPEEDTPRPPLDVFAAFAVLVALVWINFRRHIVRLIDPIPGADVTPTLGLPLWGWYFVIGASMTAPVLYYLYLYLKGNRRLLPPSAFGKAAMATLLLLWVTQLGHGLHLQLSSSWVVGLLFLVIPATIATLLIVRLSQLADIPSQGVIGVDRSSEIWSVGIRHGLVWIASPIVILGVTFMAMGMQEEPYSASRKRFGPDAYWRQTANFLGGWKAVGLAPELSAKKNGWTDPPFERMYFGPYRGVQVESSSGETLSDDHRWFLKNQYTWLGWHSKTEVHEEKAETPLHFRDGLIYISWPPRTGAEGFLVLERIEKD